MIFDARISGFPDKVTIHEHRAPTDESIRIYAEMEEKARKRVVESIAVESNEFVGYVYRNEDDSIGVAFKLNGKTYEAVLKGDAIHIALMETPDRCARILIDALSGAIKEILAENLAAVIVGAIKQRTTKE